MGSYYSEALSAERLERCYAIAPQRVRQYLEAELDFVLRRIGPNHRVLELGCGYGRTLPALAEKARWVVGIDTSAASLEYGHKLLRTTPNCLLLRMDAATLSFVDQSFDIVVCIQNGISAFHIDQKHLVREGLRVTRPGGRLLFSSYSEKFWEPRLEWFRLQAEAGLIGQIDRVKTRNGVIACKDGFIASTVGREQFLHLTAGLDATVTVVEVDESSLFCEIIPNSRARPEAGSRAGERP